MHRFNPPMIVQPASLYSQGVLLEGPGRRLVISGQVGARPDGAIEPTLEAQITRAFANFMAVVAHAGMGPEHVVKIVAYALSPAALAPYRAARDAAFAGHAPASTYVQVAGLAHPDFLFEVEGEAFAP
jgi:enamine deaminase RidA (YjgF/YER057c/UK114 family)